jgi:hypothetical protein
MLRKINFANCSICRITSPIADELASPFAATTLEVATPYLTHYGFCAIFNDPILGGRDRACDQISTDLE